MAAGLLRPFIDLSPCSQSPIFAQGIEHYWDAFDGSGPGFGLQRTLPKGFRTQALKEIGFGQYCAEDPRAIPEALRSPRWEHLCQALDDWRDMQNARKCGLVWLLHALCFYDLITHLLPPIAQNANLSDAGTAELAYARASAVYAIDLPNRVSDYAHADLGDFIQMAQADGIPPKVGFDASIKLLTHLAKNGGTETDLMRWRDYAASHLETLHHVAPQFEATLCESRFHRAAAFIPQRQGDRDAVIDIMDAAERCATALVPKDAAQDILMRENLHPLLESRTKEAIWLKDSDLALKRAKRVTEIDPFEARGWLEVGQVHLMLKDFQAAGDAYLTAAMIGPPASAIAYHMAGICFLELGQQAMAAIMLKSALDLDPGAVSTRDHLRRLPDEVVFRELKRWSLRTARL